VQKSPSSGDQQTDCQFNEVDKVLEVQTTPLGDVAATVAFATAQKRPSSAPQVTERQFEELGSVLEVQVIPSGDVIADVEGPLATATNKDNSGLQQMDCH
jgi:hypothetical protein